ncbi:MAG: hypothetical protein R2795_24690 [Saprospiraceae bacterium]
MLPKPNKPYLITTHQLIYLRMVSKQQKMLQFGIKNPDARLEDLGIQNYRKAYWNESPEFLAEATIIREQGILTESGALAINTGKFTGRSLRIDSSSKMILLPMQWIGMLSISL